ncbi:MULTISPECIES: hypothetical protein [Arthrobacter]|uniref:Helix-turn-helix domain-containing protein n=2 Tax=Arthrobacter TaxID=1663 RepID=A0ABU9KIX7_9MICC|nr:hypothetical protein [Arthrobacter sp. YJM1]MDP5226911.1 hypothetical protein [Arthrobacter sp. YJM1]
MTIEELERDFIGEAEAAEIAHETERTFRQRRYDGNGPAYIKKGKTPLYRRSAVVEWLLSLERPSGA